VARHPLGAGDLVRIITATGGGYGAPTERDPQAVAEDVRNGYITVEEAREQYGAEVDPSTYEVVGLPGR
jgi:N-methylhydantoinase B